MRILIIGSNGMLGKDLVQEWLQDEIISATSSDADIRDLGQVRVLIRRTSPDWVVLTAAYTDVDGCEKNPERAFAVNGEGTKNVATASQELGAKLFYISTDYLFDGTATRPIGTDRPIAPLNVYGKSKAAGEVGVQAHHKSWCIARTSWLFGASGASFPEKILKASETRPELTVVADQFGSPTFTRDLAGAIRELVHKDARGVLNVTNSGFCSWFDFAKEVLRQAGRESIRVLPITTAETGRAARRPAYSVLCPASLNSYGIVLRPWQEATKAYLDDLRAVGKLN
jgi:dTDP-4-dehydrorhamnose reductase